jgi:quercetin dioxygenase-like cupin family protein
MTSFFFKHGLAISIVGATLAGIASANAGECPADKVVASNGQKPGATAHKGVTEKLLGQIDLAKEKIALADHHLRMRRLEVAPGGEVAWHSHDDRPALIYIVSGTITEFANTCSVPIVHKAGDLSIESHLSHWWKNSSNQPTVLLAADIAADMHDNNM